MTKQELIEFFSGVELVESQITLDTQNGKNTGFAVIELNSEQDKARALDYNKKAIGARWIGVTQAEVMKKNRQE